MLPEPSHRPRMKRLDPAQRGFTMIEVLGVLVVIAIIAVIGMITLQREIHKGRLMGFTQEASVLVARARTEAIRRGVTVVVQPDFANRELFAFANADGDAALTYTENLAATARTVDYPIGRVQLPPSYLVNFHGPADAAPDGPDAIDGLTPMGTGKNAIVFEPDGSVRDVGALRIADTRGNFLELRIEPQATARITVLKYHPNPPWGDPAGFFEQGHNPSTGEPLWQWY